MPRLEGKRSNFGLYVISFLVLVVGAAVLVEYFGIINLVPNFGRERNQAVKLGMGLDINEWTQEVGC